MCLLLFLPTLRLLLRSRCCLRLLCIVSAVTTAAVTSVTVTAAALSWCALSLLLLTNWAIALVVGLLGLLRV